MSSTHPRDMADGLVPSASVTIDVLQGQAARLIASHAGATNGRDDVALSPIGRRRKRDLAWLRALSQGLGQRTWLLAARRNDQLVGHLPLAFLRSPVFGRHLVSLPYASTAGVVADDPAVAAALVDRAVELSRELRVRFLELRHETRVEHPDIAAEYSAKVHMRLPLPPEVDTLWKALDAKVRNQVRKGDKQSFTLDWGRHELLADFHGVFGRNMRDLGTPAYGRRFFAAILDAFPDEAELCVVRLAGGPIAAALLLHGDGTTEVPSASALREHNASCVNMWMYWRLLSRAIERGQQRFDFGRSTAGGGVHRFKRQWGAVEEPSLWQYHLRRGAADAVRPESGRFQPLIALWKRLPLPVANAAGAVLVRGIP
jgi:serine/alanine adding enzyme